MHCGESEREGGRERERERGGGLFGRLRRTADLSAEEEEAAAAAEEEEEEE